MPKKVTEEKSESSIFDYLRFGESYTSLILGVIVVIVSTILLLSFVHNKNVTTRVKPDSQTKIAVQASAAPTTPTPTVASPTPTKVAPKPEVKMEKKGEYVVKRGDTLWTIAEKEYKSGYNWVDIARVNKLNNPNTIHVGNKLVLPKVAPKVVAKPTVIATPTPTVVKVTATPTPQLKKDKKVDQKITPTPQLSGSKITGAEYKIVKGDNLWNIAVRAYGDGYQWTKISKANKLVNPNIIHPGNKLTIPRVK